MTSQEKRSSFERICWGQVSRQGNCVMNNVEKFETAGIAPPQRLAFWNELVDHTYSGTFVNAPDTNFSAEMWRWKVGDLSMIRPRSEPSRVGRRPNWMGHDERVVLHLQRRGTSIHRQAGKEAQLNAGDFSLSSADQGYDIDLPTRHEMLVVEFPRRLLAARIGNLEAQYTKRISGASPSGRIFHDFLLSLWQQGDQSDADPEWQSGVSSVFFDLAAMAMRGSEMGAQTSSGSVLRKRVVGLVDARLSDPDLRTTAIADELHVSPRTVQNVFAAMGTTPGGYVMERRLNRAAEVLTENPSASITTLAYDLGFNDSAYFTRCFRQKFGTTPSSWREVH
jgi:AraC-like DNA-binding protein